MQSWFQKLRGAKSKVPKTFFVTDLKPEIVDILVLLHRLKGEVEARNFVEQLFFLVEHSSYQAQELMQTSIAKKKKAKSNLAVRLWGCCNIFLRKPIQDDGIMY